MSDEYMNALPAGFEFEGYRIERVLGAGGFGITYLATEIAIDRQVAIKEFLPVSIAGRQRDDHSVKPVSARDADDFSWGLDRFRKEAATLVAFRHPNIVSVLRFFEANGTSYLVMEYEHGESLEAILRRDGTLDEPRLQAILMPVLDGLEQIHEKGFLHRDIKPENIYVRQDGSPVLIDFGAARQALSGLEAGLTAIVTEGFAPVEQYENDSAQGPYTDIYALAASLYRCMTGERPTEAPRRTTALAKGNPDPLTPIAEIVAPNAYSERFIASVEYGLRVFETDRPQTIAAWRKAFAGGEIPEPEAPRHRAAVSDESNETIIAGRPPVAGDSRPAARSQGGEAGPAKRGRGGRRYAIAAGVAALLIAGAAGAYFAFAPGPTGPGPIAAPGTELPGGPGSTAKQNRALLEKAVTDARAAYEAATTPEDKATAFEKVIQAETELAKFLFARYPEEGKQATKQATDLYQSGKPEDAVKAALEGAKYGDPNAMNVLGVAYEEGKGAQRDFGISTYWFRRAAELGDEFAQANLALNYYRGRGVEKDPKLAYRWAARAAVRNHVDAQYLLGILYERGEGIEKDYAKALNWYEEAARQGDRAAMFAAGRLYENGLGTEKDVAKAIDYYRQAARKGHNDARKALAALEAKRDDDDPGPQ